MSSARLSWNGPPALCQYWPPTPSGPRISGLLRLTQPSRFGGLQAGFRTQLDVTRELARGCGSTAWVASHLNICAWFTGMWNEQAQQDVWAGTGDHRVAGVFAPTGTATEADDG